jgi:hypothetical protein
MLGKQRGITFIGWLFLLIPLALVLYAGIRLVPVYLNYAKVARVLDQVNNSIEGAVTINSIRSSIDNRLYIEGVTFPTAQDISIRRDGQKWLVQATYEDDAPLFANISLRVVFDKTVEIQ